MAVRQTKRRNRVYEGRFKGTSETHMPNELSRVGHDATFGDGPSYVDYVCPICSAHSRVHKLELKIHRCPECSQLQKEETCLEYNEQ